MGVVEADLAQGLLVVSTHKHDVFMNNHSADQNRQDTPESLVGISAEVHVEPTQFAIVGANKHMVACEVRNQ